MTKYLKRALIYFMLTSFSFVGFTQSVQAALIGTSQAAATVSAQQGDRARILAAFERPEIQTKFEKLGVSKADAQARVAALTDDEAASLANKIDQLPAGGDGVIGALVLIFIVLLVTDLLGLTKVFPFTRAQR